MGTAIYKLTREIAIITSCILFMVLISQGEIIRSLMHMLLLLLFIISSKLFQKRYSIVTTSYVFVFVIIYFVNTLIAGWCTRETIQKINSGMGEYGRWLGDYYPIYFFTILVFYFIIILYLKNGENRSYYNINVSIKMSKTEKKNFLIGMFLLIIIYFLIGKKYEVLIPLFVFLSIRILFVRGNKKYYIILFLIFMFLENNIFKSRYQLIEILFPFLMIFLILFKSKKKIGAFKINIFFVVGIFLAGVYGIVSEVYKLNTGHGENYDIFEIIENANLLFMFFYRQFFRIFIIWIKLGGYIIYHVKNNGFYYGMSYVKSLANVFGFEYVSLPKICAVYNGSTYAQPGLLAEGYANLGILGAVANLLAVFFLMEYLSLQFYKKPSYSRLFYMVIPFSKILLDGGTLNSAIYMLIMCFILDFFNFVSDQKKSNMHS